MATTKQTVPPEQRIVLYDVSWENYETLLANYEDKNSPRFTYDRGVLEIVSRTFRHEQINRLLAALVGTATDELVLNVVDAGSTTFRRRALQRGFEPDSSFYLQHAHAVMTKVQIDLDVDPPPDLVIEIDVTNPSLDKISTFAAFGVPEIWQYTDATGRISILCLAGSDYRQSTVSKVLPPLTAGVLSELIEEGLTLERKVWNHRVRAWVHEHR